MLVHTERFGPIEVPETKLIRMQKPILGFENLETFVLVEQDDFHPFMWLQSVEQPELAFIVANPVVFFPDYRVEVHQKEVGDLLIDSLEHVEMYVIVTVPEDPEHISVNLQGPIVVNTDNNLAKQLVLVNSTYHHAHRLLDAPVSKAASTEMPAVTAETAGV